MFYKNCVTGTSSTYYAEVKCRRMLKAEIVLSDLKTEAGWVSKASGGLAQCADSTILALRGVLHSGL